MARALPAPGQRRQHFLSRWLLVGLLGAVVVTNSCRAFRTAFLTVPSGEVQRRTIAAALAAQVLLPAAQPAHAGDRDRASMLFNARKKYLPRMLKFYKKLKADGQITEQLMKANEGKDFKKFISALDSYGSIQRMSEAPDKISKGLMAQARDVEEYMKAGNYEKTIETLDAYQEGIPAGPGKFTWADEA
eukprot:TRINITY_DN16650_c0_g1_i1.p1 TRINITY_DN16650_c0_g1~~TRINITY_DN16650_c0_g1_i1.p1  ORF type:complete len:189 (+),score=48.65 TRINITY_DN16650_c0_g1_i1:69-635(+)